MTSRRALAAFLGAAVLTACGAPSSEPGTSPSPTGSPGGEAGAAGPGGTITLYTTVTQETVDAVLAAFAEDSPGMDVEVFRAPTGELNARIAADLRTGGVNADVIWHTDPLSMQQHSVDGLLRRWTPEEAGVVAADYQSADEFWGTRILNLVIVHHTDLDPVPTGWADFTEPAYQGSVAIPDPGFAGSAFGALGYFALNEEFGFDFYRAMQANGAVQLQGPPDVVNQVAEGRYQMGMTLDSTARTAIEMGSPIEIVWPEPGAIAIYSPIAVFDDTGNAAAAEAFTNFVLTVPAQEAIASTGWQPIRDDVEGPPSPQDANRVAPDWPEIFGRQSELLEEYRSIIGG